MTNGFWLLEWIDEYEVKTREEIGRVLSHARAFERAIELAEEAAEEAQFPPKLDRRPAEATVVAGRGLDLSGTASCNELKCMVADADKCISTIGHYFDSVVVEGLGPSRFLRVLRRTSQPDWGPQKLETHVAVLLHLRQIGAEPFLRFVEKPYAFCQEHYQQHAVEIGLPATLDDELATALIDELATGTLTPADIPDGRRVMFFRHPMLALAQPFVEESDASATDTREAARQIVADYCVQAIGDAALAKELSAPLASNAQELFNIAPQSMEQTIDDVALVLQLPILVGIAPRDLIAVRAELEPQFEKFRAALTAAIRERVAQQGDREPAAVAEEVVRDYVRPAVADIEVKLRASRRALTRKTSLNVAVVASAVTIGLLGGMPLVVGTGALMSAGILAHANRFLEDRQEVEVSDMYFLWRSAKELGHA